MKSVKVRVHGAGSLDVEHDARALLAYILTCLMKDGIPVKELQRGRPKKNPVISQGAAGVAEQG